MMKSIGDKLHISPSTISRVLNNKPGVNPKTRALVKQELENTGIIKNKKTNNIIIIIPDFENPYFGEIIKESSRILLQEGFQVSIYDTDESLEIEKQIIKAVVKSGSAGVIFCVSNGYGSSKHIEMLRSSNIPVVLFDRELEFSLDGVFLNDFQSAILAVEFLIKNNCRKIALLYGPLYLKNITNRINGYKYALEKYGIELDDSILFQGNLRIESGYEVMKEIDVGGIKIDAILVLNNFMTIGVLDYINNNNIQLYKEVRIFGYDMPEYVHALNPNFNYISRSKKEMAVQISKLILNKINKINLHTNTVIIEPIIK